MKPALLVIDIQKAFYDIGPAVAESLADAVEYTNAAVALFREKGLPVICIQHVDPEDNLVPGQPGFDLPDALHILPDDVHIHKTYGNAFNRTTLEDELRRQGVDTVILTGFCAEYCVLSTCRGAADRDLTPILLRGALASVEPSHIPFVERINDVISFGALKKVLG